MTKQFHNKAALITGAASGIGRSTALAFAQAGAQIIVSDVAVAGGEETVQLIREAGGEAHFVRADVSNADDVVALVDTAVKQYGRLDIGINNACVGINWKRLIDYGLEDWNRLMAVNLTGVFLCMRQELKQMLLQGEGAIVNVASIAGLRGLANSSAYTASKHGVVGLTKAAALEYASQNIRINAVCPVFTRTPLFEALFDVNPTYEERIKKNIPMRRYGKPEEIAQAILWLCSDGSDFMTGHALPVDGGMMAG